MHVPENRFITEFVADPAFLPREKCAPRRTQQWRPHPDYAPDRVVSSLQFLAHILIT